MTADSELIERARKLKPAAVDALLQSHAGGVYRIAYALSGRWDAGRGIARFVLNRSVRMMPKWDAEADADNWFHRFTVMTSRRSGNDQPAAKKDVLVEQAINADAAYIAFIAAVRQLEAQQREAILLRHGEKLNSRCTALAMDCSTEAAENHLTAAEASLKLVAGANYDALLEKMTDAYIHLSPEPDQLRPTVNRVVFRQVSLRRLFRRIIFLIELAVLAAIVFGGWKLYHMLRT